MRSWRSSIGVLLCTQGFYLVTILSLVVLAFSARATVASSTTGPSGAGAAGQVASQALAVPVLVDVVGTLVGREDGLLAVHERGGASPVGFSVDPGTTVIRDGEAVALGDLRRGDALALTVDGLTGRVVALRAAPGATVAGEARSPFPILAAVVLIVTAAVVFARRRVDRWALGSGRRGRVGLAAFGGRPVAVRLRQDLVARRHRAWGL